MRTRRATGSRRRCWRRGQPPSIRPSRYGAVLAGSRAERGPVLRRGPVVARGPRLPEPGHQGMEESWQGLVLHVSVQFQTHAARTLRHSTTQSRASQEHAISLCMPLMLSAVMPALSSPTTAVARRLAAIRQAKAQAAGACSQAVAVARQYLQEDKADLTCQPAFRDG